MKRMWMMVSVVSAAACAAPAPKPGDSAPVETGVVVSVPRPTPKAGDREWDQAVIDQLGRDARALANPEGCQNAGMCRTAPLGVKACGGPREYVVYCTATTDSVALYRKLDELARAERAFNERHGIVSTCELRVEPAIALVGQGCRAAP